MEPVSIIVIARNEEFGIEKCLRALAVPELAGCQVICVDSGSQDGTLRVMRSLSTLCPDLTLVTVQGYSNAAVARNAGLHYARHDFILFLDGDVELDPAFLYQGLRRLSQGAGAVTGRLRELQYSRDFRQVLKEIPDRFHIVEEGAVYASGGCFLASRAAVERTGLFDERLEKSQDYDYTLRLSRRFPMMAIPVSMGTHHTVGYHDPARFGTQLRKLHALFFGAVLRRNCGNLRGILWLLSRRERGIALGGLLVATGVAACALFGAAGAAVGAGLLLVDLCLGLLRGDDVPFRLYLHYLFPFLALAGCLRTPDRRGLSTVELLPC